VVVMPIRHVGCRHGGRASAPAHCDGAVPNRQDSRAIEVTISIGMAALGSAEDDAAGMLKRADLALYRAKRDGRNRVVADAA